MQLDKYLMLNSNNVIKRKEGVMKNSADDVLIQDQSLPINI